MVDLAVCQKARPDGPQGQVHGHGVPLLHEGHDGAGVILQLQVVPVGDPALVPGPPRKGVHDKRQPAQAQERNLVSCGPYIIYYYLF